MPPMNAATTAINQSNVVKLNCGRGMAWPRVSFASFAQVFNQTDAGNKSQNNERETPRRLASARNEECASNRRHEGCKGK